MRRVFLALCLATIVLALIALPRERADPAIARVAAVSSRTKAPGYERSRFGPGWRTERGMGCDMRAVVIGAALSPGTRAPCAIDEGTLTDPYSGDSLTLSQGRASPVEIDHVFPLAAAWDLGASRWSDARRSDFANDPLNLVAVSREENQEKSDQLPSQWLPSDRGNRCWYAGRLARVAVKYELPLPRADLRAMKRQCLPS